jgi:hypothetical protein
MIAQNEAAEMLKAADASRKYSTEIYRYNRLSPYFYIWGGAWTVAFCIIAVNDKLFEPVMPLSIWGAILTSAIFSATRNKEDRKTGWRVAASFVVMWIFAVSFFSVLTPNPRAIAAYFPLLFAAFSAGIGLWIGVRYIAIGVLLAAATLFGYHRLGDHFYAWMAIFAGGSLLLTGYWLRRA